MAKNDEMIKSLMAKVAEQKEALGVKQKVLWQTNAIFKFSDSRHINLNAVRLVTELVDAMAFLLNLNKTYDEAAKILGVSVTSFEWNGYTVAEWTTDFKTRISILAYEAKKAQLDATQGKLSTLVSEEARTEMELENIAKLLG